MIERPLDFLNDLKGKEAIITLKDGDTVEGTLFAFDIHLNIVLDATDDNPKEKKRKTLFVRGDAVVFVEAKEDGRC